MNYSILKKDIKFRNLKQISNISLLFFFLFGSVSSIAQFASKFEHNGGKIYTYDNEQGKLHHFEGVFSLDPETDVLFKKFNLQRKSQRIVNYTSLGFFAVANIVGLSLASGRDIGDLYTGLAIWVIGHMAAVGTAIFGNLIAGIAKGNYKKEMLHRVNSKTLSSKIPRVNFQVGDYGLGLAIHF